MEMAARDGKRVINPVTLIDGLRWANRAATYLLATRNHEDVDVVISVAMDMVADPAARLAQRVDGWGEEVARLRELAPRWSR